MKMYRKLLLAAVLINILACNKYIINKHDKNNTIGSKSTTSILENVQSGQTVVLSTGEYNFSERWVIPSGVTLKIESGALIGGELIGNKTIIKANPRDHIFSSSITLSGSWNVSKVFPQWWGAKNDSTNGDNNPELISKGIKFASENNANFIFDGGIWASNSRIIMPFRCNIIGINDPVIHVSTGQVGLQCLRNYNQGNNYKINNITIDGLTIKMTSNVTLPITTGAGILIDHNPYLYDVGYNRVVIRNCNVYGCPAEAIKVNFAHNILLENNHVENGPFYALTSVGDNSIIRNNTIINCGYGIEAYAQHWVDLEKTPSLLIHNNVIKTTSGKGINEHGEGDVKIYDNFVQGSDSSSRTAYGIVFRGSPTWDRGEDSISYRRIENNTVKGYFYGIFYENSRTNGRDKIEQLSITENEIIYSYHSAIKIDNIKNAIKAVKIEGNYIKDFNITNAFSSRAAIYLKNIDNGIIDGNEIVAITNPANQWFITSKADTSCVFSNNKFYPSSVGVIMLDSKSYNYSIYYNQNARERAVYKDGIYYNQKIQDNNDTNE